MLHLLYFVEQIKHKPCTPFLWIIVFVFCYIRKEIRTWFARERKKGGKGREECARLMMDSAWNKAESGWHRLVSPWERGEGETVCFVLLCPTFNTVGYIKNDTQIRAIKNAKDKSKLTTVDGVRVPTRPTPQGLGRKFRLALPQGLGRKFWLAWPLRASDANTDSPDPPPGSGAGSLPARTARLRSHGARTHDVTSAYRSRAGWRLFQPPWALQPHLFHCVPLPLSLWRTASR